MEDPFRLDRFLAAQDSHGTYALALAELRAGRKTSHWMWFVFPQIAGLGHSAMAVEYAMSGLDEATAYLAHPVLGRRLEECARALLGLTGSNPVQVLGPVDATKLRSCMTLFERADPEPGVFVAVLERYFAGERDPETLARLGGDVRRRRGGSPRSR